MRAIVETVLAILAIVFVGWAGLLLIMTGVFYGTFRGVMWWVKRTPRSSLARNATLEISGAEEEGWVAEGIHTFTPNPSILKMIHDVSRPAAQELLRNRGLDWNLNGRAARAEIKRLYLEGLVPLSAIAKIGLPTSIDPLIIRHIG
jgi:hypothetical protein